ncbi:MAG: mechanosensitive ion channel [Flavobacteriales bacterium]|nr:mechanosensitive ion channel [Flavobacteriales bacterium]
MKEFIQSGIQWGHVDVTLGDALIVILVISIAQLLIWFLRVFLGRIFRKTSIEEGKRFMILRLLRTLIYAISAAIALETIGVDLTLLWASSAALLVGVGIGLQNFFNDVISGFVLLFEGGVRVGDELEVDGMLVRVERIDLRSTRVITRYGNLIVMPNGLISGQTVRNFSQGDTASMLEVKVGVAYGTDAKAVERILIECANSEPLVIRRKETTALFQDFGDSSLNFSVYFWVNQPWSRRVISSNIRFSIDEAFRKEGIRIPFPQRDIHVISPEMG